MNDFPNKKVFFEDLGLISYEKGLEIQQRAFNKIIEAKIINRELSASLKNATLNYLYFCEHHHVYTLGKSGSKNNLLISEALLKDKDIQFFETNRGGDITYHGPGQLVGYPVIDLENFFTDIHKYMRFLEESVILTLKAYGVEAGRISGLTGVWVDFQHPERARKICALGVKTSRWVAMHGFAFNVNTDLSFFDHIIPCGIEDKSVTSLAKELGHPMDFHEVSNKLKDNISTIFGMNLIMDVARERA